MAADKENLTQPLPGLTGQPLTDFLTGLDEFEERETIAQGLGPVFNAKSCAECHDAWTIIIAEHDGPLDGARA